MGYLFEQAKKFKNNYVYWTADANTTGKVSIIIPAYYPSNLMDVLQNLSFLEHIYEIIVVDDTGSNSVDYANDIKLISNRIRLLKHKKNLGRPAARNTGAVFAKGDILCFLDQDMLLSPDFLSEAIKAITVNKYKGIALGLRETRKISDIIKTKKTPNMEFDWRIKTRVFEDFVDLTVAGVGGANNRCKSGSLLKIIESTNHLRDLGVCPENTIGFWDLPSMVVSHTMAISREAFFSLGGFPEWIVGWGGEDIVIGFTAIADGNPIIMTNAVSYHIEHAPHSGSDEKKQEELIQNIKKYRSWAQSVNCFPKIDENLCENRVELIL